MYPALDYFASSTASDTDMNISITMVMTTTPRRNRYLTFCIRISSPGIPCVPLLQGGV